MKQKNFSKLIVAGLLFLFSINEASAQRVQKIGEDPFTINVHSVLELQSTTKGFLPPRMTGAQAVTLGKVISPALTAGMIIYATDEDATVGDEVRVGLNIWNGTDWQYVPDGADLDAEIASRKAADDEKENSVNKSTNTDLLADDDTVDANLFPTQVAVKTYVDDQVTTINAANAKTVVSKSTAYTVDASSTYDYTILCTGAMTLTLPVVATTNSGRILVIRKVDTDNSVLTFEGGSIKLDGSAITTLNFAKTVRVQSNGADAWVVID